jgi:hypothetical protein
LNSSANDAAVVAAVHTEGFHGGGKSGPDVVFVTIWK